MVNPYQGDKNIRYLSILESTSQIFACHFITYAFTSLCWHKLLFEDQFDELERLQNFALWFVFGLHKYDHVSSFRAKLNCLPIRLRKNAHTLSLLYSILFDPKVLTYLNNNHFFKNRNFSERRCKDYIKFPLYNFILKLWNTFPVNF